MTMIVDLSHPIRDGMVTYPELPAPVITDHLSRENSRARHAPGHEFQIGRIGMVANTGTYLDAPGEGPIGPEVFEGLDLADKAVSTANDLHTAGSLPPGS